GAEALADRALQSQHDRRILHAEVAVAPGDLAGQPGADGAVVVAHPIAELAAALGLDGRQAVAHHALGELALVERLVPRLDAEPRLSRAIGSRRHRQQRAQVEPALSRG